MHANDACGGHSGISPVFAALISRFKTSLSSGNSFTNISVNRCASSLVKYFVAGRSSLTMIEFDAYGTSAKTILVL